MKDIGFSEKAKLEININECGIFFVGNVEGYLALARFCTYLAEVHELIRSEPRNEDTDTIFGEGGYHLSMADTSKAIIDNRYIFSPWPIKHLQPNGPYACIQDVIFHVSDQIGPEFWKDQVKSGSAEDWIKYYGSFGNTSSASDVPRHEDNSG